MSERENEIQVAGNCVYVLNASGYNRWWFNVQPGQDDQGKRITDEECKAIAQQVAARLAAKEEPQPEAGREDRVNVLGVRADGSSAVLGFATMPPKMKAKELVREQFGPIDEDGCNDAALAYYACEMLIEWMAKNPPSFAPTGTAAPQAGDKP